MEKKGLSKSFRIEDLLSRKANIDRSASETEKGSHSSSETPRRDHHHHSKSKEQHQHHNYLAKPYSTPNSCSTVQDLSKSSENSSKISTPQKHDRISTKDSTNSIVSGNSGSLMKPTASFNGASSSHQIHHQPYRTSQSSPVATRTSSPPPPVQERFPGSLNLSYYDNPLHRNPGFSNAGNPVNPIFSNGLTSTGGHHVSPIVFGAPGGNHGNPAISVSANSFAHHPHDLRAMTHAHPHLHPNAQHLALQQLQHLHPSLWDHHNLLQNQFQGDFRNHERAALFLNLQRLSPYGVAYGNGRSLNPILNVANKRKGGQIRFSNSQTARLEKAFLDHKYLNASDRKKLATTLSLSDRQVKTWFQNRRAKWRKRKPGDSETQISDSSYSNKEEAYSPDDGGRCDSIEAGDDRSC